MCSERASKPPLRTSLKPPAPGSKPVALVLRHGLGDGLEERLVSVFEQLAAARGCGVAVASGVPEGPPAVPALSLEVAGREVAHWLAVPEGPERGPFMEALDMFSGAAPLPSEDGFDRPADVLVLIAPECPNCPNAVRASLAVAAASPAVTVSIVDVTAFPELAARWAVRSVPMTVVDGGLTVVGVISRGDLLARLRAREGSEGEVVILASMLEAGRLDAAGARLAGGSLAAAFARLWASSTLESRMGLMLAAETALDLDPTALDDVVPHLLAVLEGGTTAHRGDTVELLGRIADPRAEPAVRALLSEPDEDLVEAAEDALERIGARISSRDGGRASRPT